MQLYAADLSVQADRLIKTIILAYRLGTSDVSICKTDYGRARASARSDHYVFALFFRIPFFFFLCHAIVGNLSCRKPRPTEMKFGR
jgi:hypothetical protein